MIKYDNVIEGRFLSRPNRFIAYIDIDGNVEICHVKNTGRCKELLIPGVKVFIQKVSCVSRKTEYDLIGVLKGNRIVNIDSQVPNKVFSEWTLKSNYFGNIKMIKSEYKYLNSRFDFYIETSSRKILVEVKGATLEESGGVFFPDAPTLRGIKHLNELCKSMKAGYEAYVFFVIQMKNVDYFAPNYKTHREFGMALENAVNCGVKIISFDCDVGFDYIEAGDFVDVRI